MAGRQPQRSRAGILGDLNNWVDQKAKDVERLGRRAEAAARAASQNVDRFRQQTVAAGQQAIADVGQRVRPPPPAPTRARATAPRPSSAAPTRSNVWQGAVDQGLAGARGAQDAFTFGLGDRAYAGIRSLVDASQGADLGEAYARRMAVERQRDAFDAKHYGAARTVGQVLGTGAQIAATGGVGGAALGGVRLAQGGSRIAQATPLIARELAALGAGGGAVGMTSQGINDIAQHRLSSPGDYLGAGVGGAVGAFIARTGRAGYAGAAEGATTSLAQDILNGRRPSIQNAREGALVGGALGGLAGLGGRVYANSLSRAEKEALGEAVSRARTWAKGDKTETTLKSRAYMSNGKYTYPDQRTSRELVESKFGRSAKLSKRQLEATQLLQNYRVDHTTPGDVGAALALPAASLGSLSYDDPRRRYR